MMASDFLIRILEHKQQVVAEARAAVPEARLRELAEASREHRPFAQRLAEPGPYGANIIAEIKRASPSRGPIRPDLDPVQLAARYEEAGAAAISVLTDQTFFQAQPDDLERARNATGIAVLRKDFIISAYQLYQAAVMGADAALLIVRAMPREQLKDLLLLCEELHLDALVEVHSVEELEQANWAGARTIGINNRDLTTFKTDLANSMRISKYLGAHQVAVAESGIGNRSDIERLMDAGIYCFLIGESLVRAEDPGRFLASLLGRENLD